MPFPDELARGLAVVAYDHRWPGDFAALTRRIQDALGQAVVRVSHVGSTSVPGLAAKDCIDVRVEVQALAEDLITGCFTRIGFRLRPEPWNRTEPTPGGPCPKLVFAPPEGERASNIHVVEAASDAARYKLLRAHGAAWDTWSDFGQLGNRSSRKSQQIAYPASALRIGDPAESTETLHVLGLLRINGPSARSQ